MKAEFNCTGDEYFFNGHYATQKILPGHIIVEAFGQSGALLTSGLSGIDRNKVFLVTIEKMRFRKILLPPFCVQIEVTLLEKKMNMIWLEGRMYDKDVLIAEGKWGVQCNY